MLSPATLCCREHMAAPAIQQPCGGQLDTRQISLLATRSFWISVSMCALSSSQLPPNRSCRLQLSIKRMMMPLFESSVQSRCLPASWRMAAVPKPMMQTRLCELLEEQQEPFLLDVYLLEHGYYDRTLKASSPLVCWPCRRLSPYKRVRRAGGFLRFLLNKVVCSNTKLVREAWRIWECGKRSLFGSVFEIKSQSSAVKFLRLSYSDEGDVDREDQQWRARSPVSVLELHTDEVEEEAASTSNAASTSGTDEGSWICHGSENGSSKSYFFEQHYAVICHECSSSESRKKLVEEEEEVVPWEGQTVLALAAISNLIDFDLSKSKKEWSHWQHEMADIGVELERIIFEELREETLADFLTKC